MRNWYARAEAFTFIDTEVPRIHFSFEFWSYDIQHMTYYASRDTNRWRVLHICLCVGQRKMIVDVPWRKLPDYIPSERTLKLRGLRK